MGMFDWLITPKKEEEEEIEVLDKPKINMRLGCLLQE